jgi:interferon, gamma-inducible protein 30
MATDNFLDMADIQLFPYGNAHEVQTIPDDKWKFQCQHGDTECGWNMVEACAKEHLTCPHCTFSFIECIEENATSRSPDYEGQTNACAKDLMPSQAALAPEIITCHASKPAGSDEGNALMHSIAVRSEEAFKDKGDSPYQYVPWVVADGVHSEAINQAVTDDLLAYVCKNFKGEKTAACDKHALDLFYNPREPLVIEKCPLAGKADISFLQ